MKPITRDISVTLVIKIILLFLLWWFCVRGIHPVRSTSQEWLLGQAQPSALSFNNKTR